MLPSDPLQLTGTTIAEKYAVESVVGEGGFAVVYRATHLIWKRPVAIKAFKSLSTFREKERDRLLQGFLQEGALLADLSERSAAICQARDVGTLTSPSGEWVPYMVLEWLEGVTLERALDDERSAGIPPRTAAQAAALLEPAAEALALAHRKGIAHRDLKPANVFLLGDPRGDACAVKLLDFGIAKVVQDAQKSGGAFSRTAGEMTSFTPAYGAPEQFSRSHGATGPWTDVFALGLLFTELVAGREPLEGENLAQLAHAAMDPRRRPTPRALGAAVDDAVDEVIARAVAVDPAARYATAGQMWNALRAALGQEPLKKLVTGDAGAASLTPPPSPSLALSPPDRVLPRGLDTARPAVASTPDPRTSPRSKVAVVGGALAAAALLGGIGITAARSRAPERPSPVAAAPSAAIAPPKAKAPACPEGMIRIPGGKFFMGSDDKADLELERPAHQVALRPFCIDKYEVTTADYKACSDRGECKRAGMTNEWEGITAAEKKAFDAECNARDPEAKGKHPINCVDWEMAAHYCRAQASTATGEQRTKRLPTEAEWEFAARGPDGRKYPWGDEAPSPERLNACGKECVAWGRKNRVDEVAMYGADDGWATTAPVGWFPAGASRYGVQDVVGNVWEWVEDWYAPYTDAPADNPKGPPHDIDGQGRVIRGGAWNGAQPSWVRPTFRYHDEPGKRSYGIGFRCAADVADADDSAASAP